MYTSSRFSSIFNIDSLKTTMQICLLVVQGKYGQLKSLFLVVHAMLVSKKSELILTGVVAAKKDKDNIKSNSIFYLLA